MKKIKRIIALVVCSCLLLASFALGDVAAAEKQTVFSAEKMFSDSQNGPWRYLAREVVGNTYKELTYDAASGLWKDAKGGTIGKDWMHSSADASADHETQIVLEFECPYTGTIDILDRKGYVSVDRNTENGVKLWVWRNNDSLLNTLVDASVDYRIDFGSISTNVTAGDKIRFILSFNGNNAGDSTMISPVINYTSINADGNNENSKEQSEYAFKGAAGKTVYNFKEMFSASQSGLWHYMTRETITNVYTEMTYDPAKNWWEDGKGGIIATGFLSTTSDASDSHESQTCIQFEAPNSGKITIYSLDGILSLNKNSENGIKIGVIHNDKMLLSYDEVKPGQDYDFKPITVDVVEGDKISFVFVAINGNNANDTFDFRPVIVYESEQPTLASQVTLPKSGTEADGVYDFNAAFDSSQGPVWYYLQREVVTSEYRELSYDSGRWIDAKGGILSKTIWHPTADASASHEWSMCAQFKAPSQGNITIYSADGLCSVSSNSADGVKIGILHGTNMVMNYTVIGAGEKYIFKPITLNVDEGDTISFLLAMNKDNAGDSTTFDPVIVYNSYEKIIQQVDIEVREDDPNQTVYRSYESYGQYVNPWYYKAWKDGAASLTDMTWDAVNGGWRCEDQTSCMISEKGMHPGREQRSVRVFKAPKSGYVDITMLDDMIKLTSETFAEMADGVYASILIYDGASATYLMEPEWLYPDGGETFKFKNLEKVHIYKDWEIWFVLDENANNASDSVQYAPVVTYTEITDEVAPVYLNSEEELKSNSKYFAWQKTSDDTDKASDKAASTGLLMNLLGVLTVIVIAVVLWIVRRCITHNNAKTHRRKNN